MAGEPDGSFLIRDRSVPGDFTLIVRWLITALDLVLNAENDKSLMWKMHLFVAFVMKYYIWS